MRKYFRKLVGERVYLSPQNLEDAELYTKWINDLKVTDWINRSSQLTSKEREITWMGDSDKNNEYNFTMCRLVDDVPMGCLDLRCINTVSRTATVGIFIGDEENRNSGYGTEALGILVEFGFNYLNLNNIMLEVNLCNERAQKSYEKIGFKEFGRRHQSIFVCGEYYDSVYMEILRKDYKGDWIKNSPFK
ncbi:MAG: GNAT family N-acetyltransferase [Clostridioides sp.]|jgi:RimJ/RimL family protein N-acetyltransferase|nr:GNAT family N-acetyltransferase [Clostridioides sp.]